MIYFSRKLFSQIRARYVWLGIFDTDKVRIRFQNALLVTEQKIVLASEAKIGCPQIAKHQLFFNNAIKTLLISVCSKLDLSSECSETCCI